MVTEKNWYNGLTVVVCLLFIGSQILFFPKFYTSIDEHEYLKNAMLLQSGTLNQDDQELACGSVKTTNGFFSNYTAGRSIFTIPFLFLGLFGAMASGIVIHLINFFIVAKIFQKLKINTENALLYLLLPTFVWNSRTLNSELLVLTTFLAAAYFFLSNKSKDYAIAGFMLGLALIVRADAVLGMIAFSVGAILKSREKVLPLVAGFLVGATVFFIFNLYFYENLLPAKYQEIASARAISGGLEHYFETVAFFFVMMAVIYPFMLFVPLKQSQSDLAITTIVLAILSAFVYAKFTDVLAFEFSWQLLPTARIRYIIPAIGMLFLTYPKFYEGIIKKHRLPRNLIFYGSIAVLLAGSGWLSYEHSKFVNTRYDVLQQIYANTPDGSLIIGSSDDCIYFLNPFLENRRYLSAAESDVKSHFDDSTYFLLLEYGHQKDRTSVRQKIINAERQQIAELIEKYKQNLTKVFEANEPHQLEIYKLS